MTKLSPGTAAPAAALEPVVTLLGNPANRRVAGFQDALGRAGLPPARVLAWGDLLAGRTDLVEFLRPGSAFRIESPGEDEAVERELLAAGADVPDDDAPRATRIGRVEALELPADHGRIRFPRQAFLGFRAALRRLETTLAGCPGVRVMNAPAEVAVMFDKPACHAQLQAAGVPVPAALATPVNSGEELLETLRSADWRRVFVKPAHGSSASGVIALETDARRARWQGFTSVETVRRDGELLLYNSLRVRRYVGLGELLPLLDALCRECVQVERWLPKAGLAGRAFDLRVLVVAGRARHVVVRTGRTPMTNLHLGNARGDPAAVRARMGEGAWAAALATCERAAACFPGSLHAGVDLLILPDFQGHAVAEVNAFGDLLPRVLDADGLDTYGAEVAAMFPAV